MIEEAYAVVVTRERKQTVCDFCLKYSLKNIDQKLSHQCEVCDEVYYCSIECKEKGWSEYHDLECAAFQFLKKNGNYQLQSKKKNNELVCVEKLLVRLLVLKQKESEIKKNNIKNEEKEIESMKEEYNEIKKEKGMEVEQQIQQEESKSKKKRKSKKKKNLIGDEEDDSLILKNFKVKKRNFDTVEALYGSANSLPKKKKLLEIIGKTVLEAIKPILKEVPSLKYIIDLASKNESNAFGFYYSYDEESQIKDTSTEAHLYAFGIYPLCSLFNHSCMPNTFRVHQGKILQFKMLHDIPKNTEICHSYIHFEFINTNQRQTELFNNYGFWCKCPCCQDEQLKEKFIEENVCPRFACGGLLATNSSLHRYCLKCKTDPKTLQ